MNIQDALRKRRDEIRRKQAHIAGQTDQVDLGLAQRCGHLAIIDLALQALRRYYKCGQSASTSAIYSRRALTIAQHQCDFRVGNSPGRYTIRQGLEVRATPTQEHTNAPFHEEKTLAQERQASQLRLANSFTVEFEIPSRGRYFDRKCGLER